MKKYYYFYDLNEVLIDRYPAKISKKILEKDASAMFVFIFSEKYREDFPDKIPEGSKSFYIPSLSKNTLKQIIELYPPISLTTIAQRIPDMWIISFFNCLGIPTNIVQHGLWSDKLQRIPVLLLLLKKFSKFVLYLSYVYKTSRLIKISFLGLLKDLFYFLLKENKNVPELKHLNNDSLRANRVFSFDGSWDDYYIKKYGYSKDNLVYIGNPDLLLLKDLDLEKKENAVCYLCQSLVEDGRLSQDKYSSFLQILANEIPPSKKLYIKLHPRSRMELYEVLKDLPNVVFTENLPVCQHYIGHYTGLLATVKQISDNILIWLFINHHTPDYFKMFGKIVTNKKEDIQRFLKNDFENNRNDFVFNKLSHDELKSFDPIEKIANELM